MDAESAAFLIELKGRDTDIDHGSVKAVPARFPEGRRKIAETAVHGVEAGAVGGKPLTGQPHGLGIPVEPQNLAIRMRGEKRAAVPAESERAVQNAHRPGRFFWSISEQRREIFQNISEEHRNVLIALSHFFHDAAHPPRWPN